MTSEGVTTVVGAFRQSPLGLHYDRLQHGSGIRLDDR